MDCSTSWDGCETFFERPPKWRGGSVGNETFRALRLVRWLIWATLEDRAVVVTAAAAIIAAIGARCSAVGVGGGRRGIGGLAQGRVVFSSLLFLAFLAILDGAETLLHEIKFRSGDDVLFARGKNGGDFFLGGFDTIRCGRMGGEELGNGAGMLLFVSFDFFEEGDKGVRVVTGLVHVLKAEIVGFALGVAIELQVGNGDQEGHAFIKAVSDPAARTKQD